MQAYIDRVYPEYLSLLKTIAAIPAPSHKEQQKADFLEAWLRELCARQDFLLNIFVDEASNVVCECFCDPSPEEVYLFLAHTDTVFPDEQPLPVTETEETLAAPGIGDDTANVAALLMGIQYLAEQRLRPQKNVVFVFNSCEEGLGNLKGCRAVMDRYAGKVREFISFDGGYTNLTTVAVGSERYEVRLETIGGHSYGSFGNPNAIALLSELICRLYEIDAGAYAGHTTYNVGVIAGGTSVNTIAQEAHMLFEFRADRADSLSAIKQEVFGIIEDFSREHPLSVRLLGARPSMGEVDPVAMQRLIREISDLIEAETGARPTLSSGSTDCNIPLSRGIPAICFGAYLGHGAHTREEFLYKSSLRPGLRILIRTLLTKFH